MRTRKDRRHSGYITPKLTIPKASLYNEDLCINPFYDDWINYRDGQRDWFSDFKKIKKVALKHFDEQMHDKRDKMNKKQKRLLKIRLARLSIKKAVLKQI